MLFGQRQTVRDHMKRALQQAGLFPIARSAYRLASPGIRHQKAKEIAFYTDLLPKGGLCFDVGANLGQKAEAFLACGASAVLIEPNPLCLPALKLHFGRNPRVTIERCAVGASAGEIELYTHGTDSTASVRPDWDQGVFGRDRGATPVKVPMVTLDTLIERHGTPDFMKIDVEGFEESAFAGLSKPVPVISFEYHASHIAEARRCIEHLQRLDPIAYRASDMHCNWLTESLNSADECLRQIEQLRAKGDLFVWFRPHFP